MLSNFASFCTALEELAASYLGANHVKAVVSGDIGLIITLKALGLPEGAPCYISTFTFNSTMNAALWAGLQPVLIDIDPDTFNLSTESLKNAMEKKGGTGVVLATHVFGNPCNVPELENLARARDCFLIFDSAHGYGSKRNEIPVGRFGDAEVFSLSGTKIVTSAEGGLVATPHRWLAEKITYLRAYGFQNDYNSKYIGINGKISEIHSALGVLSLSKIEELLVRRHQIVEGYKRRLQTNVKWQRIRPEDRSTFKDVCIGVGGAREAVQRVLQDDQIQTKRYFLPLHFMQPYKQFMYGAYPVTEEVYDTTLCIPAYADLTEENLDRISRGVLKGISL